MIGWSRGVGACKRGPVERRRHRAGAAVVAGRRLGFGGRAGRWPGPRRRPARSRRRRRRPTAPSGAASRPTATATVPVARRNASRVERSRGARRGRAGTMPGASPGRARLGPSPGRPIGHGKHDGTNRTGPHPTVGGPPRTAPATRAGRRRVYGRALASAAARPAVAGGLEEPGAERGLELLAPRTLAGEHVRGLVDRLERLGVGDVALRRRCRWSRAAARTRRGPGRRRGRACTVRRLVEPGRLASRSPSGSACGRCSRRRRRRRARCAGRAGRASRRGR